MSQKVSDNEKERERDSEAIREEIGMIRGRNRRKSETMRKKEKETVKLSEKR